ncbi:GNAT family N-acetyltransferase [Alloscardovia venturai]|uniref:GNAT family N-acetyltransferase n=1 Tax=Alloscardovia venturai TaxID=1769421 RepID=A0ABW2Y3C7_9BIFI
MTTKHIHLRPYESGDFDALAVIMFDTWYSTDIKPDTSADELDRMEAMARLDVAHYLATSTHAVLAVSDTDGQVLGAALWRNDSDWSKGMSLARYVQMELESVRQRVRIDDKFAQFYEHFVADSRRTGELAAPVATMCGAELRLFMMSPLSRGKGVGKKLLSCAEDSMRQSGAHQYYLYTDTECDYSFYDHRRLECAAQQHRVTGPSGALVDKFIYVGKL